MAKRVVFVPGLPGTKLHDVAPDGSLGAQVFPPSLFDLLNPPMKEELKGKLRGPSDLSQPDGILSGEPIKTTRFLGFDLAKQAASLYEIFKACGVEGPDELRKVGWDWRLPVTDPEAQANLAAAIDLLAPPVVLVVHSTGGLLARHFLETHPSHAAAVERVIAFGVPWAGTLKSFAVLTGHHAFPFMSAADTQDIYAHSWAAYDLMPRSSSAGLVLDAAGAAIDPLAQRQWMPNNLRTVMEPRADHSLSDLGAPGPIWSLPIPVTNLVGFGWRTHVLAQIGLDGGVTFNPGLSEEVRHLGDGTVPLASSAWLQGQDVATLQIPIGAYQQSQGSQRRHSVLWRNPGGRAMLKHLLADEPLDHFCWASVDWSDKVDPGANEVRIRFVMQDVDGTPRDGAFARVVHTAGSPPPDEGIGLSGRGLIVAPRGTFRLTSDNRFRRVGVELHSPDGGVKHTSMLIEP